MWKDGVDTSMVFQDMENLAEMGVLDQEFALGSGGISQEQFKNAIKLGEVVVIEAEVTRAFNSSMEVAMQVWAENMRTGDRRLCTTSFYTFVSVDADGRPIPVPEIIPESDFEKERYEQAADRREMRLKISKQNQEAQKKSKSS